MKWLTDNFIHVCVVIWFISSLVDLSGIIIQHTDTETKISVEKKQTTNEPVTENGPKESW